MNFRNISNYIEDQFPEIYREEGETLVSFLTAYYEFLDSKIDSIDILSQFDIDETSTNYLNYFKKTYLNNFPFETSTSKEFMVKHIMDYYRSKGSIESTKLLIRLLFNEDANVYYPSNDILKPSESNWHEPRYIEITRTEKNSTFLYKKVVGSASSSSGIVEGIVTKRVNGKFIDVLYLSNIRGNFQYGEKITSDGNLHNSPVIVGSLTDITIENGGANNKVGDVFNVISVDGVGGKARVTEIEDKVGRVNFKIEDGGTGYTITSDTKIYVSDVDLNISNNFLEFYDLEKVYQKVEQLRLISVDPSEIAVGKTAIGNNMAGSSVATGKIIKYVSSDVANTSSFDVSISVDTGTFNTQRKLSYSPAKSFKIGEIIEEESSFDIEYGSLSGPAPAIGQTVVQSTKISYDHKTARITVSAPTAYTIGEDVVQKNINGDVILTAELVSVNGLEIQIRNIVTYLGAVGVTIGRSLEGLTSSNSSVVGTFVDTGAEELYTSYASGIIDSIAGNIVTVKKAFGLFSSGEIIEFKTYNPTSHLFVATSSATIISVTDDEIGARGTISSIPNTSSIVVENIFGSFDIGKTIRGNLTKLTSVITSNDNEGATDVVFGGVPTANGVIYSVANTSPNGIVVGQNTTSVGVFGDYIDFFSSSDAIVTNSNNTVESISVSTSDIATINTPTDHNYLVNDTIKFSIVVQVDSEVFAIDNVFDILTKTSRSFTIKLSSEDAIKIYNKTFAIFSSSIQKTIVVPLVSDRKMMLSPPRNSSGSIIDVSFKVLSTSTGSGASFKIGTLENEETVFLNTDIIGNMNIVGTRLADVVLDGSGSGVGFINSILVTSGGTGYANNQVITFSGGGLALGEPISQGVGIINTNATGSILEVVVVDHGQGYYETPTIIYPSGNSSATLNPIMSFGYGLPKNPGGGLHTPMIDLLTNSAFTIGTISSLSKINPGSNYNQDPFAKVYNPYIAGFNRTDYVIDISNISGGFRNSESVYQEIPDGSGSVTLSKGYVLSASSSQLIIRRSSFNVAFTEGFLIKGNASNATATIDTSFPLLNTNTMGNNAEISSRVVSAIGVAKKLEIIDSGFGYISGGDVILEKNGNNFVVSGISETKTQGIGEGYWKTTQSHLNSTSRISDNDYYQEYSYDVLTGVSLDKYKNIIKNILHVSGTKLFGQYFKNSAVKNDFVVKSSLSVE